MCGRHTKASGLDSKQTPTRESYGSLGKPRQLRARASPTLFPLSLLFPCPSLSLPAFPCLPCSRTWYPVTGTPAGLGTPTGSTAANGAAEMREACRRAGNTGLGEESCRSSHCCSPSPTADSQLCTCCRDTHSATSHRHLNKGLWPVHLLVARPSSLLPSKGWGPWGFAHCPLGGTQSPQEIQEGGITHALQGDPEATCSICVDLGPPRSRCWDTLDLWNVYWGKYFQGRSDGRKDDSCQAGVALGGGMRHACKLSAGSEEVWESRLWPGLEEGPGEEAGSV